ncbi:UNKNOWN [Stylonychia lemnae]|uniref:Major facilitator superfamily protein n=1 Tax=Stylonychia lemnae TaxID=5949 RepID=A0A078A9X1_STYLE|nr:UNKNOWN [Stylonychia lemnae]|eukprot:CDW78984.1 UNKNOWN [Stylonychia lemnae]
MTPGQRTLLGGFIFQLFDKTLTLESSYIMIPLEQLGHMTFNPVAAYLYPKVGPTVLIIVGSTIALGGIFASSFAQSFQTFAALYGVFYGLGIGISYMAPLMCGWEHYPHRKGLVSGIVIGGFGFGSFVFDIISTFLVNPHDEPPSIQVQTGETVQLYFDKDISSKAPDMLRKLVVIWIALVLLSLILVRRSADLDKMKQENQQLKNKKIDYLQSLKSQRFLCMWIMLFLSMFYGMFMANAFKSLGVKNNLDDITLTIAGSIGSIMNGGSRIFWPIQQDKSSFEWVRYLISNQHLQVYKIILVTQLLTSTTLYFIAHNKILYIIWVAVSFFCLGGQFTIFPTACVHYFGLEIGPKVYAILFTAIGSSSLMGYFIGKYFLQIFGYEFFFALSAMMTLTSLLILMLVFQRLRQGDCSKGDEIMEAKQAQTKKVQGNTRDSEQGGNFQVLSEGHDD